MDKFTVERELKDLTNEEVMRIFEIEPIDSARKLKLRDEIVARMNKTHAYYGNQQLVQQHYLGQGLGQQGWNGGNQ